MRPISALLADWRKRRVHIHPESAIDDVTVVDVSAPSPTSSNRALQATDIVARLRQRREILGINQADLAERIGCSDSALGRWERRKASPNLNDLCAWCEELKLNITLTDPCSDETSPPTPSS